MQVSGAQKIKKRPFRSLFFRFCVLSATWILRTARIGCRATRIGLAAAFVVVDKEKNNYNDDYYDPNIIAESEISEHDKKAFRCDFYNSFFTIRF